MWGEGVPSYKPNPSVSSSRSLSANSSRRSQREMKGSTCPTSKGFGKTTTGSRKWVQSGHRTRSTNHDDVWRAKHHAMSPQGDASKSQWRTMTWRFRHIQTHCVMQGKRRPWPGLEIAEDWLQPGHGWGRQLVHHDHQAKHQVSNMADMHSPPIQQQLP